MLPLDSRTATHEIITQTSITKVVALYKQGATTNPKIVKLRKGEYWLCRVPDGVAGSNVMFKFCMPTDTVLDAEMAMPTFTMPATEASSAIDSRDSTKQFILGIDPETDLANEKTAVAVAWDGAADSTLIMVRIKG